jgi:hypothetical protein
MSGERRGCKGLGLLYVRAGWCHGRDGSLGNPAANEQDAEREECIREELPGEVRGGEVGKGWGWLRLYSLLVDLCGWNQDFVLRMTENDLKDFR